MFPAIDESVHKALHDAPRRPRVFKNAVKSVASLFSWQDVELALNNYGWVHPRMVETIDEQGEKRDVPVRANGQLDTVRLFENLRAGHSLLLTGASRANRAMNTLVADLEKRYGGEADVHVYAGLTPTSRSFDIHWDSPDNFIVQVEGVSRWKLYATHYSQFDGAHFTEDSELQCVASENVEPGDLIYIPSGLYHWCLPVGKRLSLSIPLFKDTEPLPRLPWLTF